MSNVSPTLAVLFHRLGPYHFARLRAAGRLLPIVAIESSGVDETYAWDVVAGADHFERVTLFDRADAHKLPAAEVVSRVGSALDKVHPAVVVVPGWADSAALGALRWCVQNHVPAIVMSESTAWDETRVTWKEWVKQRIVRLCSSALAGGRLHKEYLVKLGMPAERIFLGYDAVDNDYFAAGAAKWQKLKAEIGNQKSGIGNQYGLPEKYFLASARFVGKKNLSRLVQAYARYRELAAEAESGKQKAENVGENVEIRKQKAEMGNKEAKSRKQKTKNKNEFQLSAFQISAFKNVCPSPSAPWDLVLLGDGPLRETLNSQLLARDLSESTLNLHAHVQMPGFKQYGELLAYYGLASAFIHASTTEQWGLVVNEAMASGLPVLVSDRCGCAADLVQEGRNGFSFDPYNIEALAQLMLKISAFNFQLSTFGSASREIIAAWGPERFAKGLHDAVETALKNPRPRAGLLDRLLLRALIYK